MQAITSNAKVWRVAYPTIATRTQRAVAPHRAGLAIRAAKQEDMTEQTRKVKTNVKLGDYKNDPIKVTVKRHEVDEAQVEKMLEAKQQKTYTLKRINFTGSGAKLGHTVKVDFVGKYAEGDQAGQVIKGTEAKMYELELVEDRPAPWCDFVSNIVTNGMGQEESKTFITAFPADYAATPLRGVKARFTVTVKEISVKEQLSIDQRPIEEQREELRTQLQAEAQGKMDAQADAQIKTAMLQLCEADVEKIAESVSWAKFGPKSLAEFKWNLIQEEVAHIEGIAFDEVVPFLRRYARVMVVDQDVPSSMQSNAVPAASAAAKPTAQPAAAAASVEEISFD